MTRPVQAAAVEIFAGMKGSAVTAVLMARHEQLQPAVQARILNLLGRRGDAAALPLAMGALKSADAGVRSAALAAVGSIGNRTAVAPLLEMLAAGKDPASVQQARVAACLADKVPGIRLGTYNFTLC